MRMVKDTVMESTRECSVRIVKCLSDYSTSWKFVISYLEISHTIPLRISLDNDAKLSYSDAEFYVYYEYLSEPES